tara:strand:+ start:133 stop:960 length:828 start_codon:yes stop_codon:yes gene_type:complete
MVCFMMFASIALGATSKEPRLLPPDEALAAEAVRSGERNVAGFPVAPGYYLLSDEFRYKSESNDGRLASVTVAFGAVREDKIFNQFEVQNGRFEGGPVFDGALGGKLAPPVIGQGCSDLSVCYTPDEQPLMVAASTDGVPDFSVLMPDPGPEEAFLSAARAFVLHTRFDEDGALIAHWKIAAGYYLYRDQFAVSVAPNSGYFVTGVELAPGHMRTDAYFGEVEVFYNEATLVVRFEPIDSGHVTSLAVDIVYQGCAEAGLCYPPITESLSFEPLP